MGMTMTQKILAAHAGLDSVQAGQLIEADLDLVLGNDITSPVAIHEIEKMKVDGVFHKDKIALVMDHFVPNKDIKSAQHCKCVREFACKNEITNYFDVGEMGIEHALLPEKGLTVAGDVIIGADSHTCTYGALGAFSTGVGSTDMAAGMATGKAWFKVPSAIKFRKPHVLHGNHCQNRDDAAGIRHHADDAGSEQRLDSIHIPRKARGNLAGILPDERAGGQRDELLRHFGA